MTSILAAFITKLKANATVTGYLGGRVYVNTARQGVDLPYAILYGTRKPEHHLTGKGVGLGTMDLTIEVYTEGEDAYRTGQLIVDAIRNVLDGMRTTVNVTVGQQVEQVEIKTCILDEQADSYIPPIDGGEQGRMVNLLQFSVGYAESIPSA